MYARTLYAGAFFSYLRARGSMEMKGQEEDKQQDRRADQPAEWVRILNQRSQHARNLS
jgi:hypothetical protein